MLRCFFFASLVAFAQPPQGARDMYFGGFEPAASPAAKKTGGTQQVVQNKPTVTTRPNNNGVIRNVNATGPLGLRYSIVKVNGAERKEVPVSTRFQAGDRIQIKIQSNSDGYLYIVSQGTSGNWQTVFPSKARASNRIHAGEDYILPKDSSMRFAGQPGTEKLFVVLSRTPEADLDSVIYNLTPDKRPAEESMQIASNMVSDPLVNKLRSSHTRDLVLEEVSGPATQNPKQDEKAMYVVSRNSRLDARVVADIRLIHE